MNKIKENVIFSLVVILCSILGWFIVEAFWNVIATVITGVRTYSKVDVMTCTFFIVTIFVIVIYYEGVVDKLKNKLNKGGK